MAFKRDYFKEEAEFYNLSWHGVDVTHQMDFKIKQQK